MSGTVDLGIEGLTDCRELDSGGFADVYEARDEFGRRVAIKVLKALDEAARRRFDRERAVMGRVAGHPHIVTPFTSGYTTPDSKPYVVMEFLAGGSLQQRLDRHGPLPVGEAIEVTIGIADALGASHRADIIHKDVKPANILLTEQGRPKLADFGIASIRDVTETTSIAYSPAYTPPETFHAASGSDVRDERSDLYSLAATLYALVVGQGPYHSVGDSPASAMARILNEPPPRTGSPPLDRFLLTAMAKDPADRYQRADTFIEALRAVAASPLAPAPAPGVAAGTPASWPSGPFEPTVSAPGRPQAPLPAGIGPGPSWPVDGPSIQPPAGTTRAPAAGRLPVVLGAVAVVAVLVAGVAAVVLADRAGSGGGDVAVGEEAAPTDDGGSTSSPDSAATVGSTEPPSTAEPTPTLGDPGDLSGTSVVINGVETSDADVAGIEAALAQLSDETGITITYGTDLAITDDLVAAVDAGDGPDIALLSIPDVVADLARAGDIDPLPADVATEVSLVWNGEWTRHGNVDGVQYGVPNKADPKSLVWYKPARFEALGYDVPATWTELVALTERAAADGNTPWCVGIESGVATGWPFTDWVEDVVLRRHGADVYDQWAAGDIRFSDPRITGAFDEVRDLWALDGAVHAAGGTIDATSFSDNADPLVEDDCLMHRQASFFSVLFPSGTPFADGSADAIDVFYLPSEDENRPMVSSGSWAVAFDDRPEVWVVMAYLGSAQYADRRQVAQSSAVEAGSPSGFLTAVDGIDRNLYTSLENSMLDVLAVAGPVRYDASDQMPPAVGAGAFWAQATVFVNGGLDAEGAAASIDAAWPR